MANEETLKVVDYIDRFEVLNLLSKETDFFANPPMDKEDYAKLKLLLEIKFKIDRLPTADVEEVKRGHWITNPRGFCFCSECLTSGSPYWKRCPICEAKMDGGKEE